MRGIGQLVAQSRREEPRREVHIDRALSEQTPDDFGQRQPLGDRLAHLIVPAAHSPATSADRPPDPQHRPGKCGGAPRAVHIRS
jgi:hypothetical protein